MTTKSTLIAVRCNPSELAAIDTLAKLRTCSRAEAVRIAMRNGIVTAQNAHSVDIKRLLLLIEYTQAAVDVIVNREHSDAAAQLEKIAHQRLEQFHASR